MSTINPAAIDVTKPILGNPTTQSVRDNFAAIKAQFQAAVTDIDSKQTTNAVLTAIVGLGNIAANQYIYGTGPNNVAYGTITAYGRSVVAAADADALGLTGYNINTNQIGTPTYGSLQDNIDTFHSAGIVTGLVLSDGGAGTLDVSAGSGFIRATNSPIAPLYAFDNAGTTGLALTSDQINYIYVEYNAGTPQIVATTSKRSDLHTNVFLGNVYKYASGELHINTYRGYDVGDHAGKMIQRMQAITPMAHESGAIITEVGTRNIALTAGVFWEGFSRLTTPAFDSSVADTFRYFYLDGVGGWTEVLSQTQINNLQYDDGSGTLATLSNSHYGVHWVYEATDGDVYVVYGRGDYLLAAAQDAQPADVPPHIEAHGRLVAKIIIQKSDTVFYSLESAFDVSFSGSGVSDHQNLTSIGVYTHTQIDSHIDDVLVAHPWVAGTANDIYFPAGNNVGLDTAPHATLTAASVWQRMGPHGYIAADSTAAAAGAFGWLGMYQNLYYDTGYKYIATGAAGYTELYNGEFRYFGAVSGTGDTAASFTQGLRILPGGQIQIQDGTVSIPSLSYASDTTTGFYRSNTGIVSYASGGVRAFYMASSGIFMHATGGAAVMNEVASATNPTLIPNNQSLSSGVGAASAGVVSIITGGTERMRYGSGGGVFIPEMIGAEGPDIAGYGQIWIRDDAPNTLMFTDDVGNDYAVAGSGVVNAAWQVSGTDLLIIDAGVTDVYLSDVADSATPSGANLRGQNGLGTDIAGGDIGIVGGQGTGTGVGGTIVFAYAPAGTTGSLKNATATAWTISGTNGGLYSGLTDGPALLNEASGYTNPTIIPRKDDLTTGLAAGAVNTMTVVANSIAGPQFFYRAFNSQVQTIFPLVNSAAWPTIAFGDGDSGFYESSDDNIYMAVAGFAWWHWSSTMFNANQTNGPGIQWATASSTVPTILPSYQDTNTGLGWAGTDLLSLITNSVERVRVGNAGGIFISEVAAADTPVAGYGQIWVKSDIPNTLWFTDDGGTDYQLNTVGASLDGVIVLSDSLTPTTAIEIGLGSVTAGGDNSLALGNNAFAYENNTIAIGNTVQAGQTSGASVETFAIAVGYSAASYETGGISLGASTITGKNGTTADPYAIAIGYSAQATNQRAVALGNGAHAYMDYAIAVGYLAVANEQNTIAIGQSAQAGQTADSIVEQYAIAIGYLAKAYETGGVSIGYTATTGKNGTTADENATAIGNGTLADAGNAIAMAYGASARAFGAVSIGYIATAKEYGNIAIGWSAVTGQTVDATTEQGAIAIGYGAASYEIEGIAIGRSAVAGVNGFTASPQAIAIGKNALADKDSAISIGNLSDSRGTNGIALGYNAQMFENYGIAIGANSQAGQAAGGVTETGTIALGFGAKAYETNSVAIGANAWAGVNGTSVDANGTAVGTASRATGLYASAFGDGAEARGDSTVAVGKLSDAREGGCIAIGQQAQAGQADDGTTEQYATAVGYQAKAYESFTIAIGSSATAGKSGTSVDQTAIAVGSNSISDADGAISFGYTAYARASNAVAIGYAAIAYETSTTVVGYAATAGQTTDAAAETGASAFGASAHAYNLGGTAIGGTATAGANGTSTEDYATAIGYGANAVALHSVAIGYVPYARAIGGIAIGYSVDAKESYGIAIGYDAQTGTTNGGTTNIDGIAIGRGANTAVEGAIALGAGAQAPTANTMVIGGVTQEITQLWIGSSENSATAWDVGIGPSKSSGTNIAGGDLTLQGGVSTGTGIGGSLIFQTSPRSGTGGSSQNTLTTRLAIDDLGNVELGTGALPTGATDGFLYIPTCAGAPSGTPTTKTGRVPLIFDTTNNDLYVYDGSWISVTLA